MGDFGCFVAFVKEDKDNKGDKGSKEIKEDKEDKEIKGDKEVVNLKLVIRHSSFRMRIGVAGMWVVRMR